jgi:hypothetical protein
VKLEKRIAPRHRVSKAGTIESGGGAIDRTVRNLSNVGAVDFRACLNRAA